MNYNYGEEDIGELSDQDNELLDLDDLVPQQKQEKKLDEEFEVIGGDEEDDLLKSDDDFKTKLPPLKQNVQKNEPKKGNADEYEDEYDDEYENEYEEELDDLNPEEEEEVQSVEVKPIQQLQKIETKPPQYQQEIKPKSIQRTLESNRNNSAKKQNLQVPQDNKTKRRTSVDSEKSNQSRGRNNPKPFQVKTNTNVTLQKSDRTDQQNNQKPRSVSSKPPISLNRNQSKNSVQNSVQSQLLEKHMEKLLEDKDYSDLRLQDVIIENTKLRYQLKELNTEITKKIEHSKIHILKKDKKQTKRPLSQQNRTVQAEEQNNKNILDRLLKELNKTQEQYDKYTNPGYLLDMNEEIQKIKKDIEKGKREIKNLGVQNDKKGKNLADIEINDGQGGAVRDQQEIKTQISILERKIVKYKKRIQQIKSENQQIEQKLPDATSKFDKLVMLANHYKVDFEISANTQKQRSHYIELKQKEVNLQKQIETMKHTQEVKEDFIKKDLEELRKLIFFKNEEINLKEQEIYEMNNKVRNKMEREKLSSRQLRDECSKMGIPYDFPQRKFDELSVQSADRNYENRNLPPQSITSQGQTQQNPKMNPKQKKQTSQSPPKETKKLTQEQKYQQYLKEQQQQKLHQNQSQHQPKYYNEHESIEIRDDLPVQEILKKQEEEEELKRIQEEEQKFQQEQQRLKQEQQRKKEEEEKKANEQPKPFMKPFGLKKKKEQKNFNNDSNNNVQQEEVYTQSNNNQGAQFDTDKQQRVWKQNEQQLDQGYKLTIGEVNNQQQLQQNNDSKVTQNSQESEGGYNFNINSRRQRNLKNPNQNDSNPTQQSEVGYQFSGGQANNNSNEQQITQKEQQKVSDGAYNFSSEPNRVGRNRGNDSSVNNNPEQLQQVQQTKPKGDVYDPFAKFDNIEDKLTQNKQHLIHQPQTNIQNINPQQNQDTQPAYNFGGPRQRNRGGNLNQPQEEQNQGLNLNQQNQGLNINNQNQNQGLNLNIQAPNQGLNLNNQAPNQGLNFNNQAPNQGLNLNNQAPEQTKQFNFNRRKQQDEAEPESQINSTNIQQNYNNSPNQFQQQEPIQQQQKPKQEPDLFKGPTVRQNARKKPQQQKRDIFNDSESTNDITNIPVLGSNTQQKENQKPQMSLLQELEMREKKVLSQQQQDEDDGLDFLKQGNNNNKQSNDDDDFFGGKKKQEEQPKDNNQVRRFGKQKDQDTQQNQQKQLAKQAEQDNDLFGDLDI